MFNFLKKASTTQDVTPKHNIPEGRPVKVEYSSKDLAIPKSFVPEVPTASDAQPMTMTPVDWKTTPLPEYDGRYAVVLDNVLARSECDELIKLAEASVDVVQIGVNDPKGGGGGGSQQEGGFDGNDPWRPAMINAGGGYEVLDTTYRHSDRIIWDEQELVDRLWARCLHGEVGRQLRERLEVLEGQDALRAIHGARKKGFENARWEMRQLNRRMRFLRYGPGQFFKPHCDSFYAEDIGGKSLRTVFTVHLYLNDSVAEVGEGNADLVGGATSFLSNASFLPKSNADEKKVDVDPKAGRVLIFQHMGLNHSGDWVTKGVKYTMRTEIMYEMIWKD